MRRLLELKRSTDAVFASVSRAVAVKKAARDKKARRRAEEAAALLARGENPHVAFRRRDRLAEATREARERRDAHESRMAEIKKRLAREERELDDRDQRELDPEVAVLASFSIGLTAGVSPSP